jgi:benzoylsuccinyl-CoA thiolase BbsB subunit
MNGLRDVVVLGVGQTVFGKHRGVSPITLGVQAAKAAIEDVGAGFHAKLLECVYASRSRNDTQTAENIMQFLGVSNLEMHNTENACASGGAAVNLLWKDIAYGVHDIGIAIGTESMTSEKPGLVGVADGDLAGTLGFTMPALAGLCCNLLMETCGCTQEDIAYPSIKNHRNAVLNPYAMYKKEITFEDVMNSRIISAPCRTLHCCPVTDGAAAVILCTPEIARKYTSKLVKIVASNVLSAPFENWDDDILDTHVMINLAKLSYQQSGFGPEDMSIIELHDAFSCEEIYACRCLGLCQPGDERKLIHDGTLERTGKHPMNVSGGLQSLGHPLGASGVRVVAEVASQLRGTAGTRQLESHPKVGLAQMIGGYLTGLSAPSVGAMHILSV